MTLGDVFFYQSANAKSAKVRPVSLLARSGSSERWLTCSLASSLPLSSLYDIQN